MATGSPLDNMFTQMQKQAEEARLANMERQKQVEGLWNDIIARYSPGGALQKNALSQLEAQKARDVTTEYGQSTQDMISRGLFGTSVAPTQGGVARKWEQDVGVPSRIKLEDIMAERLSSAQSGKAGMLERIENEYPDTTAIAQLMMQASNVPVATPASTNFNSPLGMSTSLSDSSFAMPKSTTATSSNASPYSKQGTSIYDTSSLVPTPTANTTSSKSAYDLGIRDAAAVAEKAKAASTSPAVSGVVTPTAAEQAKIEAELRKLYPQMFQPGWGTSNSKNINYSGKVNTGYGKAY